MTPISKDAPLNIHCIFSPEIADHLPERFFSKLKFTYADRDYSASRDQLIQLGRRIEHNNDMLESTAYAKGIEQYIINCDVLDEIFKSDKELREKTLIVVSNKDNDGASGVTKHCDYLSGACSQLDATRQRIYQMSDMIFSGNSSDTDYFLGRGSDDEETVKRKCGSLMPCIHGCDAHTNLKVFQPELNRYCWIKADPTFNGLKQLLYEPKDRVRISSTFPEQKQEYYIIDHIEIDDDYFAPDPIHLNDKLTCIIGGKSTGKSLLLHNIALAIDAEQVNEKIEKAITKVKRIPNFRVYWRDGICSDGTNKQRKIVYIPQTYLNRLSDDDKEKSTEIDEIIQAIVLQDNELRRLYDNAKDEVKILKQAMAKNIMDFLKTHSECNLIIKQISEIGGRQGVEGEIKRLKAYLETLSKEYDVSEEEARIYHDATERIQLLTVDSQSLISDRDNLERLNSVLERGNTAHSQFIKIAQEVEDAITRTLSIANKQWISERDQIVSNIATQLLIINDEIRQQNDTANQLKPKMEGNEQINTTSALILTEKGKFNKIKQLEAQLSSTRVKCAEGITLFTKSFKNFRTCYAAYEEASNRSIARLTNELEFHVDIVFKVDAFVGKLHEILNNKTITRFQKADVQKLSEAEIFDKEIIGSLIEDIVTNSPNTLQLKAGYSPETALRELITDWYNINYVVKMDRDCIEDMSPGKKALVLLQLLISLAESKCPILIDQPEDDLDNRSIYNELVQFLKEKKTERQIIVATHNANIVLGGDAELVIVANQEGKNSPNQAYHFEYRGGSIENDYAIKSDNGRSALGILNQKGIQTHICEILEGGKRAFDLRRNKYRFDKL